MTRATGAARDEKLGEHKTFKTSRWVYSRAATGRGAGRARYRVAQALVRAEWLYQQQQAPPDMMTGQSIRTYLRREVPTDHEAQPYAAETAAGMSIVRTLEQSFGGRAAWRPKRKHDDPEQTVHARGKPSRAKPDGRCRTPFAVQTFEAKTPATRHSQRRAKVDHTWHGGIHDHADDKVANRSWDYLSPRTVPGGGGVFLSVVLGFPRPRVACERACEGSARRSLWLGVWCAASMENLCRST